ncbi:hypothetical protein B0H17DRAFT_1134702 [Mycena rosella]|uniref:Uncharacterized protein n=1 Tax=Mycena rosella TaxID=1033263 RepID=A0AAD7DFE4_MYCRO|nr:hypothetical protein B0H17DRAFT_1134702 [Mycena rosella]
MKTEGPWQGSESNGDPDFMRNDNSYGSPVRTVRTPPFLACFKVGKDFRHVDSGAFGREKIFNNQCGSSVNDVRLAKALAIQTVAVKFPGGKGSCGASRGPQARNNKSSTSESYSYSLLTEVLLIFVMNQFSETSASKVSKDTN